MPNSTDCLCGKQLKETSLLTLLDQSFIDICDNKVLLQIQTHKIQVTFKSRIRKYVCYEKKSKGQFKKLYSY